MSAIRNIKANGQKSAQSGVQSRVTINDLASNLGMSKSTVSRALNGYSDISETTRVRVSAMAKKMGYSPLSHAQAIRTGRVRALALVLQMDEPDRHNPFLHEFLVGACEAVSGFGWTLTVATAASDEDMKSVLNRLIDERKADGFILPRTQVNDPRVHLLRARGVAHILYGRTEHGVAASRLSGSWYDVLGEKAMTEAVQRLATFGHKRIAYVGSSLNFNYSLLRKEGFLSGLREVDYLRDDTLLRDGARTREQGLAETRALLQCDQPPTAIVYATDMAALGGYDAIGELGLRVGVDVSVISYDGAPEAQYARPALTTFNVDTRRAGGRLAELLIRQIRGEAADSLRELEEAVLVERASDGPATISSKQLGEIIKNNS